MQSVGVKELKDRLSSYLLLPKTGESLLVTERGKPVAVIRPVKPTDLEGAESIEERLARLANMGHIRLPSLKRAKRFKPAELQGKPVSTAIIEDRR